MVQIEKLTDEAQVQLYLDNCTKEELAKMLTEANKHLDNKQLTLTDVVKSDSEQLQAYVKWKETTDIDLGAYTEKEQLGLYFDSL